MLFKPKKIKWVQHIFFLIDVSGSMKNERIGIVNSVMKDLISELKSQSLKDMDRNYKVRILTFGGKGVQFKYGSLVQGILLDDYEWTDISDEECDGYTPMGECIKLVSQAFAEGVYPEYLGRYLATPFILLISDGQPNGDVDVYEATNELRTTKIGSQSVIVSIGISVDDNEVAKDVLRHFGKSGFALGDGARPEELAELIKQITTASIDIASENRSGSKDEENKKKIDQIMMTDLLL